MIEEVVSCHSSWTLSLIQVLLS